MQEHHAPLQNGFSGALPLPACKMEDILQDWRLWHQTAARHLLSLSEQTRARTLNSPPSKCLI